VGLPDIPPKCSCLAFFVPVLLYNTVPEAASRKQLSTAFIHLLSSFAIIYCQCLFCTVLVWHSLLNDPGSSVSKVSGYGLDDRAIEVRSPADAKGFFPVASVSRQALGPTQPPVQWVPEVLSQGLKRGRGVTLITHPI
jgi:hypothetical protein